MEAMIIINLLVLIWGLNAIYRLLYAIKAMLKYYVKRKFPEVEIHD